MIAKLKNHAWCQTVFRGKFKLLCAFNEILVMQTALELRRDFELDGKLSLMSITGVSEQLLAAMREEFPSVHVELHTFDEESDGEGSYSSEILGLDRLPQYTGGDSDDY